MRLLLCVGVWCLVLVLEPGVRSRAVLLLLSLRCCSCWVDSVVVAVVVVVGLLLVLPLLLLALLSLCWGQVCGEECG